MFLHSETSFTKIRMRYGQMKKASQITRKSLTNQWQKSASWSRLLLDASRKVKTSGVCLTSGSWGGARKEDDWCKMSEQSMLDVKIVLTKCIDSDECRHLDEAGFKRQEAATGTAQVAVSMLGGPESTVHSLCQDLMSACSCRVSYPLRKRKNHQTWDQALLYIPFLPLPTPLCLHKTNVNL